MTPEEIALARSEAIAALEAELAGAVTQAQRAMYEGLLEQLQQVYDDPMVIPRLLADYQAAVAAPLAHYFATQVLRLPGLNVAYFEALNVRGCKELRAPLSGFLERKFGVTATGDVAPGGYLSTLVGDTTAQRELLRFAYTSQASGAGITAYRQGLEALVTGGNGAKGLMETLYAEAGDTFAEADRSLQGIAAERLGLTAFLYQGGLIKSSRPFCVKRNGKVFTGAEIDLFGTSADTYGGYANKAEGLFSGKSAPYEPRVNLGGYSCRHTLHALPASVALTFRPDLTLNDAGELVKR
jgi:hypothetical protein